MLKAFDDAVGFGTLCDADAFSGSFDCLMVAGIDEAFFAEEPTCNAVFGVECYMGAGGMIGDILHERAAEEDVYDLTASADGKDGLFGFGIDSAKCHFGLVAALIGWMGAVVFFAVVARVDITAAC